MSNSKSHKRLEKKQNTIANALENAIRSRLEDCQSGPGDYNSDISRDSLFPRQPSPDMKHMIGRPESKDDSVGPAAYSPDKDKVLITNPAWSFPSKNSSKQKKDGGIEPIKERIGIRSGGRLDLAKN